jgi:hypothetical protein
MNNPGYISPSRAIALEREIFQSGRKSQIIPQICNAGFVPNG